MTDEAKRPTEDWQVNIQPYDLYGHLFMWELLDDHKHIMASGYCGDEQDAIEAADMMLEFYDEKKAVPQEEETR